MAEATGYRGTTSGEAEVETVATVPKRAELDVFVFANNGDFDAYATRLARYHKGVEDDTNHGGRQSAARAVQRGRPT